MSTLLTLGLANAACAALLAVPAFLVGRYARRPALAHALWLLVLLKLVTPPFVRPGLAWLPAEERRAGGVSPLLSLSNRGLTPSARPDLPLPTPRRDVVVRQMTASSGVIISPIKVNAQATFLLATPPPKTKPLPPEPTRAAGLADLAVMVWLTGAILCLGRALFYAARFHGLLSHGRPAPAYIQEQAEALAHEMGLRRCPRVWLVPGALPPMVWGVGRVRLLFPEGLLTRLSESERASLLTHELAHVYRRDHWVRLLELAALTLFWWFPLAWWAKRQLQAREEECCDAWAAGAVPPRVYATAILEAVDFLAEARPRLPAMASALESKRSLKERLTLILTTPAPRRLGWAARLALVAVAAAVLPLVPTLVEAKKAAPPTAEGEPEPTAFSLTTTDLLAPFDEVNSVSFSRDGKHVAAGSGGPQRRGKVELFDVRSRKSVWNTTTELGVASVAFGHDSKTLAWSGWSNMIGVMDVNQRTGRFSHLLPARNSRLAASPDGKWLAVATEDRKLQLREPLTGKLLESLGGGMADFYCVGFSPDSRYLAAGGGYFQPGREKENYAFILDMKTKAQVAKLDGHTRAIINVAFAPKNALVATASVDHTVRIWDGKDYKLKVTLAGHTNAVKGLAFSPDGKQLATGSWDGSIRLWEPNAGKLITQLDGNHGAVREIAYSPDGKTLVSGGAMRAVKLWDVVNAKELATLRQQKPGSDASGVAMATSPDGKALALGDEGGVVRLLDPASGEVRHTIKAHDDAVTTLAFSRDGKRLATGGPDTVVKVWNVSDGKLAHTLTGHGSWVYALAFSRDGKRLASGSYDRSIRLWPLDGGKATELEGHRASVRALVFSADDKSLISGGEDRAIRVWDLATLKSRTISKDHQGGVRGLFLADGGKTLLSAGGDGFLKRWDLASGKETKSVKAAEEGQIISLTLSPGGRSLVLGTEGGSVTLYDPATLSQRTGSASVHRGPVMAVAFGAGGKEFYSLGGDKALKVWHGEQGPLRLLTGHKGPVRHAVYSPDGKRILSGGGWPEGDKTLRLWDAATGKLIRDIFTFQRQLFALAFHPDGKHAFVGHGDGGVQMVDLATSRRVRQFGGHKNEVPFLSVSSDGKWLATASHDKTVKLWRVDTGKEERTFSGHTGQVRAVVFHPDGKRLLSGSWDQTVRAWDRATGKETASFHAGGKVERIALLPDGKRLLVAGDPVLKLYDLATSQVVREYGSSPTGSTGLDVSPDGRLALTCGYGGAARLWDVETGAQLQQFVGHRGTVWSARFSPDGKAALTSGGGTWVDGKPVPGDDFALRVWRLPKVN